MLQNVEDCHLSPFPTPCSALSLPQLQVFFAPHLSQKVRKSQGADLSLCDAREHICEVAVTDTRDCNYRVVVVLENEFFFF